MEYERVIIIALVALVGSLALATTASGIGFIGLGLVFVIALGVALLGD